MPQRDRQPATVQAKKERYSAQCLVSVVEAKGGLEIACTFKTANRSSSYELGSSELTVSASTVSLREGSEIGALTLSQDLN